MSEATIRGSIKTVLEAVSGIGTVRDYPRHVVNWDDFLGLFKTSADKIIGCMIEYQGFSLPLDEREQMMLGETVRAHSYKVIFLYGLDDSAATEKTAAALAETICNALDDSTTLHGASRSYANATPARLTVWNARVFGSALCHVGEIDFSVWEERTMPE